jgi:hypothetical protein
MSHPEHHLKNFPKPGDARSAKYLSRNMGYLSVGTEYKPAQVKSYRIFNFFQDEFSTDIDLYPVVNLSSNMADFFMFLKNESWLF